MSIGHSKSSIKKGDGRKCIKCGAINKPFAGLSEYCVDCYIEYINGKRYKKHKRKKLTWEQKLTRKQIEKGKVTTKLRQRILIRDNFTCQYCGISGVLMEIDHIIPLSKGGKTISGNLVTACQQCNQRKLDRTPEEAGMRLICSKPKRNKKQNIMSMGLPFM